MNMLSKFFGRGEGRHPAMPGESTVEGVNSELHAAFGDREPSSPDMFVGHEDGEAGDAMPMGELPNERNSQNTEPGLPVVGNKKAA